MRIEISTSGGVAYFPGLRAPVAIDTDDLAPEKREALLQLIKAARFFDLAPALGVPPSGAGDYQRDIVSIEDGARRHTVSILVPAEAGAVRELVQAIKSLAKRHRAARGGDSK